MLPLSKKIISSAIAACLAVTMMPAVNSVAYADELRVANIAEQTTNNEPFSISYSNPLVNQKGVSFDSKTCTLTLNNVNVSCDMDSCLADISKKNKSNYTLTINIVGSNKIINTDNTDSGTLVGFGNDYTHKIDVVVAGNGTLTMKNMALVNTYNGSVSIKSSNLDFNSAPGDTGAICANKGTVSIGKNAKVSINAKASSYEELNHAIKANKMKNSYTSLVEINGYMPTGAEIKDNNAVYVVNNNNDRESDGYSDRSNNNYTNKTVTLKRWLKGNKVKFSGVITKNIMGAEYRINKVANNAFNNKAGKKVKKLYFNNDTDLRLYKKSLNGLKGVTNICITPSTNRYATPIWYDWRCFEHEGNTATPLVVDINKGSHSAKKCFSYVGKSKGKKVTVKILPCKEYLGKSKHNICISDWDDNQLERVIRNKLGLSKAKIKISKSCYKADHFNLKEVE